MTSMPPATTAQVPVASEPSWAAVSMPRAMPEATTSPARPNSPASWPANLRPSADALRAPTIAIMSRARSSLRPSNGNDRRRRVEGCEAGRKIAVARIDQPPAEFRQPLDLAIDVGVAAEWRNCPRRRGAQGAGLRRARPRQSRNGRSIRRKSTGPTFCVRASRSHARRSASLSAFALIPKARARLRADPGFGAAQEPLDIFAMHDEDEDREDGLEHGIKPVPEQQHIDGHKCCCDQRRQRRNPQ